MALFLELRVIFYASISAKNKKLPMCVIDIREMILCRGVNLLVTIVMRGSVRPARTLFLRVKVPDAPDSGKHVVNMARVSSARWNLKEA